MPCTDNWPGQCIFWLSLWQYELGNWDTAVLKWNKCSFPNSSLFMRPWKSTLPFSWVGCRTGAGGVHPWWLDSVPYPVAGLVPPQEIIIKKLKNSIKFICYMIYLVGHATNCLHNLWSFRSWLKFSHEVRFMDMFMDQDCRIKRKEAFSTMRDSLTLMSQIISLYFTNNHIKVCSSISNCTRSFINLWIFASDFHKFKLIWREFDKMG